MVVVGPDCPPCHRQQGGHGARQQPSAVFAYPGPAAFFSSVSEHVRPPLPGQGYGAGRIPARVFRPTSIPNPRPSLLHRKNPSAAGRIEGYSVRRRNSKPAS